jgi:hypothetical protein
LPTKSQRAQRARLAALVLHSRRDSRALTEHARRAFDGRFLAAVDPGCVLSVSERERRARIARRAFFVRLALASSVARSKKKVVPGSDPETTREVGDATPASAS